MVLGFFLVGSSYAAEENTEKFLLKISDGIVKFDPNTGSSLQGALKYVFKVENTTSDKRFKTKSCMRLYDKNDLELYSFPSLNRMTIAPGDIKSFSAENIGTLDSDAWYNEVAAVKIYMARFGCSTAIDERSDEIFYSEWLSPKKGLPHYGMDWEDYVDIKKSDMKSLTYDQLLLFLKNIDAKKNGGRLNKLKTFLRGRGIPFKDGLWDWQTRDTN